MIKELTTPDAQLSSFGQPDQDQQQQITNQHCQTAEKTQEVGISSASDYVASQNKPQPPKSPQHTITPSNSEPQPINSNDPDVLSECNSLFRQVHKIT